MVSAAWPHVTRPALRKGRGGGASARVLPGLRLVPPPGPLELIVGLRCHGTDAASLYSDLGL